MAEIPGASVPLEESIRRLAVGTIVWFIKPLAHPVRQIGVGAVSAKAFGSVVIPRVRAPLEETISKRGAEVIP